MKAPELEFVCTLKVDLDPAMEMGTGRAGHRRIVPIVGGEVVGDVLRGKILNLGADWQTVFDNAMAELDTRYALETHDGALIEVINYGYRHGPPEVMQAIAAGEIVPPEKYYMRTHARLETGDPRYAWVNTTLFVGTGQRLPNAVQIDLFAVR